MSCSVCNGHPNCPCCTPEPRMVVCPECDGAEYTYYDEDGEKITVEQYEQLPPKEGEKIACEKCDGDGEVEDDYEPDYEPDYDDYDD